MEFWSPSLKEKIYIVRYWKIKCNELKKGKCRSKQLEHIRTYLNLTNTEVTLKEATKHLVEATKEQDKAIHKAEDLRAQYLTNLAESYMKKNEITLEQAIRELILHEEERDIYTEIGTRMKRFEKLSWKNMGL